MLFPSNGVYYDYWYECPECLKKVQSGKMAIPVRYKRCTLEVFDWTRVNMMVRGVDIAAKKTFYEKTIVRGEDWQVISSQTAGVGKTHLAVASMQAICKDNLNWKGLFIDCISELDSSVEPTRARDLRQAVRNQHIIILDDLGREPDKMIPFIQSLYHDFYNKEGIILATTNLNRKAFLDRYHRAVSDRIGERGKFIEITGESYRQVKRQAYEDRLASE